MSEREIELFLEGARDQRDWFVTVLAWHATLLMNSERPRGKQIKQGDAVPTDIKERSKALKPAAEDDDEFDPPALDDPNMDPRMRLKIAGDRIRRKQARAEARDYWKSNEGRRLSALLDDGTEEV